MRVKVALLNFFLWLGLAFIFLPYKIEERIKLGIALGILLNYYFLKFIYRLGEYFYERRRGW